MRSLDDDDLARSLRELTDRVTADVLVGPVGGRIATVVSAAVELLGVEDVGLLLLDDTDRVRSVAAHGRGAEVLERAQEETSVGPGVDTLTGRATVAVTDLAAEPRYGRLWQEVDGHGVRAVLSAPVWFDGQVVGNLNALHPEPHVWSPAQRRAAEALAGLLGQLLGLAARITADASGRNGRGTDR